MTVGRVLSWLEAHDYAGISQEDVVEWLYRLDVELWRDVIRVREGGDTVPMPAPYSPDEKETVLLVGVPEDEIYTAYAEYKICLSRGEEEKAADAAALYNARLDQWTKYYYRTHRGRRVPFRY